MRAALVLLTAVLTSAAVQSGAHCQSSGADGLDFWVGTWDLE